jgi:hypothetical protein
VYGKATFQAGSHPRHQSLESFRGITNSTQVQRDARSVNATVWGSILVGAILREGDLSAMYNLASSSPLERLVLLFSESLFVEYSDILLVLVTGIPKRVCERLAIGRKRLDRRFHRARR